MEAIIKFKNVNFEYKPGMKNINNISFDIFPNEYICIIGHNGSGKSTVSKLLTGILERNGGEIYIDNTVVSNSSLASLKNKIGIIFQNPDNQFIGLTSKDDIAFGLENKMYSSSEIDEKINKLSSLVDITEYLDIEPNSLSGGQKQKVAIASILALDPDIFIFDESTSMLDPRSKIEIRDLMVKLKNDFKKTVISITHNMEEVIKSDRVFVMEKGMIVKIGTPKEIFSNFDELVKLKLDLPFVTSVSRELNLETKNDLTFDFNELVEQIINHGK
jgi:energy-coupling factor transport system ATP-binding protein